MSDLGALAVRLSEATDIGTAAARLAEQLRALTGDGAVRVYLLGPGDRCGVCARADECTVRDRCFHLEAGQGDFARPAVVDQRVPRVGTAWGRAHGSDRSRDPGGVPPELLGGEEGAEGWVELLQPLEAGGETVGVVGLRLRPAERETVEPLARVAAFMTATAIRLLRSLGTANRRFEQLLLVNELGRKVNSILNDELLLRQAAVDIHRTFGFHNVMIFMVDEARSGLALRAQASQYASPIRAQDHIRLDEGVIGRVYRTGRTETIDNVSEEREYVRWFADTRSEMAVPIQVGGLIEGVLNVESDRIGAFGPSDRLVLETAANQLAIAIENARLFGMVKEREDRYRKLVESSPGTVLHLDASGRMIYANPAVLGMTGYDKTQILDQFTYLQDLALPEYRGSLEKAIEAALGGVAQRELEFQLQHREGSEHWVTAALQPLTDEHGDAKGVVVLALDRTRERELQNQLNQSEKLSAIGTLVSGVAHELNNPLAGILGFAQLLLARPPDDWGRRDIENIELNARRCQRIVENLLAFARQSRMAKRRANLNDVVTSVLNLNEYQFRMDNVEIERDFDTSIPSFPIDVHRWQQVFINLASNAHQALRDGKPGKRRIRFSTRRVGDRIEIRVSDNGPGIPKEVRSHIFDPFFTTKESGTGLGLGICFGIVEEHGGTITLDETTDEGASFLIQVPIQETRDIALDMPPAAQQATSDDGVGVRALVVDDDAYVCDVVRRVLEGHGYTVDVAQSGDEALGRLREETYEVLLTDVRMPGDYDGIDLHDRVVAVSPEAGRRVVFMTGNLLDGRTMDRLQELHVRCVEKPFDIHELAGMVREVVRRAGDAPRLRLPGTPRGAPAAPRTGAGIPLVPTEPRKPH